MRAELFRPEDPDTLVGAVEWDGVRAHIRTSDEEARPALARIFRVSPVAVDDPSRRPLGSAGPVVVEPGNLDWFLAAATVRAEREGLVVRFHTDTPGGWDPAGAYRRMGDWIGERESGAGAPHPESWR